MKTCKKCGEEKSVSEFGKDSAAPDKLTRWCRPCRNEAQRGTQKKWYKLNPEYNRAWHLKNKYGITPEQYDEILRGQGDECAACPAKPTERRFTVDHDHEYCLGEKSCGDCIRGILCHNCNVTLGLVGDSVRQLYNLINYLEGSKQ